MLAKKSISEYNTFISPMIKFLGTIASLPRIYIKPDMATVSISGLQVDEQVLPWSQSTVGPVRHIEGQLHTSQCRRSKVPLFPPVWPSPCALCTLCVCTALSVHSLCVHCTFCVLPVCALHLLYTLCVHTAPSMCSLCVQCTFSVLPVCRLLLVATSGAGSSQSLGSCLAD